MFIKTVRKLNKVEPFGKLLFKMPSQIPLYYASSYFQPEYHSIDIGVSEVDQMTHDLVKSSISHKEFKDMIIKFRPSQNIVFLDVREEETFENHFLPAFNPSGFKLRNFWIPIMDLIEMRLKEIEPFKHSHTIYCYCRSGNNSNTAMRILSKHGYNAVNVKGGMRKLNHIMNVYQNGRWNHNSKITLLAYHSYNVDEH